MSVFEELKNRKSFDHYVVEAYNELGVSENESKEVRFIAKSLVSSLLNSDDFMDGDEVDRFGLSEYMLGAMIVALASKDKIMKEASIKGKIFNVEEVIED